MTVQMWFKLCHNRTFMIILFVSWSGIINSHTNNLTNQSSISRVSYLLFFGKGSIRFFFFFFFNYVILFPEITKLSNIAPRNFYMYVCILCQRDKYQRIEAYVIFRIPGKQNKEANTNADIYASMQNCSRYVYNC